MTGSRKEAGFGEIGALCPPCGALQRRLRTSSLGNVIDHHDDLAGCLRSPADLFGIQQQHASAKRWQFDLDFIVLQRGVVGWGQHAAESWRTQTEVADVGEMPPNRFLRHNGEERGRSCGWQR